MRYYARSAMFIVLKSKENKDVKIQKNLLFKTINLLQLEFIKGFRVIKMFEQFN